jgi:predicted glycogen debranching enzyme
MGAGTSVPDIVLDPVLLRDFDEVSRREWVETNGTGGWASSTVSGAHSRRYHGLLVAATRPPAGRMVLLSKLEEAVVVGGNRFELGCNRYPNAVHPRGFTHLRSFAKGLFPVFEFQAGGVTLRKTIAAVHGENTTLILYEATETEGRFTLELTPLVAGRDYHALVRANGAIRREADFNGGILRISPYEEVPEIFLLAPSASFEPGPAWYYDFEYEVERERGMDFREDLFSHGVLRASLDPGGRLGVIVSTSDPAGRDAFELFERERERRERLFASLSTDDDVSRTLALAADQFVVRRGDNLRTVIAGYHWFTDWGRDTMIAFPGITMVTGRFEDGKRILRAFAGSVSEGMLPNRFPDSGEDPEYNTVDATLWFFVAVHKYLRATNDDPFVRDELLPVLKDILEWHERGTRYGIRVDRDGLLYAGEPGVQLTWMDAKVGDWVVTPRQGKAVEINALWYNALVIYADLAGRFGAEAEQERYRRRARKVRRTFGKTFWNDEGGYLYDVVDGEGRDGALRPNQIFALSLPFPLLSGEKALRVLSIVEERLYTPVGLRSLDPQDPRYRPRYEGGPWSRDGAYHQGTVWSWLLGPLASAHANLRGAEGRERARRIIEGVLPHLAEAGIGTVSEIFDAEPPHSPRGCIAQAWSVAEILRAYLEDAGGVERTDLPFRPPQRERSGNP